MVEMDEYPKQELRPVQRGCRPKAVLTLVGGVMVHLALGAYYTFGNMAPYIISYLKEMSGEPNIVNVDSLWIANVGSLFSPIAIFIGGALEKRFGCRIPTFLGAVVYSVGAALTYFTIKRSLVAVCATYGVMVMLGSLTAYGIPLQTAARWFPKHPTLVIGVILCGYGGSTLILNQVITGYINPENLSPELETDDGEKYFTDKDLLNRVPNIFLILGAIYLTMSSIGVALMSEPEDEVEIVDDEGTYFKQRVDETEERTHLLKAPSATEDNINNRMDREIKHNKEPKQQKTIKEILLTMVKNKNSYVIFSVMFFVFSGMQFNITLYKAYGQTFISDDKFLALVGSLAAVFNCSCRPLWGFLMDRYGFEVTTKLLTASFVCIMATISLTEKLGKVAFMIWVCASYGSFCGIFPIGPATMGKLFGAENIVINMSFTFVAVMFATLFGGLSGLTLKNAIGWHGLFLLAGCLGVIAFISTFFFTGKDEKGKEI